MISPHFPSRALAAVLAAAPFLAAQNPRIQFGALDKLAGHASEVVDINLDGPTLRMAAQFLDKDPETRAMVQGLQGIYVKVFHFDKPGAYSKADVDLVRAQMEAPGWSRLVKVQSRKGGDVGVYALLDAAGGTQALGILCAEAQELVLVNLVGPVDLKRLASLEGKLGIPRVTGAKAPSRKEDAHD